MMSFKTKLKEVIALLKQGHCTGEYAKNAEGRSTGVLSPDAVCWCLMGAIFKCDTSKYNRFTRELRPFLKLKFHTDDLTLWNDTYPEQVIPTLERIHDELED